jgi:hypothetical protein
MSAELSKSSSWPHWGELLNGEADGTSAGDIWVWWQERRLRYNLLVGIVGFITWWLVLIAGSAAVKPGVDFEEPFAMILGPPIYAVIANFCYTVGPLFDVLLKRGMPSKGLFRIGLFFSLALTALPGTWAVYCWVHSVITGEKLD